MPSSMGETSDYTQLAPKSCLTVCFYGLEPFHTTPLRMSLDTPVTCEEVLVRCAQHLSTSLGRYFPRDSEKTLGPLHLPLFGLCRKELYQCDRPKDLYSLLWIREGHVFNTSEAGQELYFRMRVRPPASQTFAEKIPPGICADYLFWQCAEDVMSGRVWKLFPDENKMKTIDTVNFNAIHIIMASAQYRLNNGVACDQEKILHTRLKDITKLQHILQTVSFYNIHNHIPKKMTPELKRDYNLKWDMSMRYMSNRYLRKYIEQFYEQNGERSLRNIRLMFVDKLIREYVQNYGLQFFAAHKVEEKPNLPSAPVALIIRPFEGGTQGLYFNKNPVSSLRGILEVDIKDSESNHAEEKCVVHVVFREQSPLVLFMADHQLAESFVSEVETFCRLKVDYHSSIGEELQTGASHRVLSMLRSYGPLQEEFARRYLHERRKEERQSPDHPQFLIYQDCQSFGLLHALGTVTGTNDLVQHDICFQPAQEENKFLFTLCALRSETKSFTDHKQLLMYLSNDLMLGQRIAPKEQELCGAMQFLKDDDLDDKYSEIVEELEPRRKTRDMSNQPLMYRQDQVSLTDAELLARGKYSEVYHFKQMEQERHAILKKIITTDPAVELAYRKGVERLSKLREGCALFTRIHGIIIDPLGIVMESMPQVKGSLLQRIQDPSQPFSWLHVSSVLRQLASCMDFLARSKLIYGNLCCAKILISESEDGQGLIIRLGDPSRSIYLDTLSIDDPQNQDRLAWVAPERFQALSRHSFATEVYSLGTTLWELVSCGQRPDICVPPGASAVQVFSGPHKLPTEFLGVTADQGEVSQLPDSHMVTRVNEWLATQNFQQDTQDVQQVTPQSQQATPQSQQATPESQQATDVEPYVRGAQYSGDSASERAKRGGSGEEQETAVNRPAALQTYKVTLGHFIHACRHSHPEQRPSATDIVKKAVQVGREVTEAASNDDQWMMNCLLRHGLDMGIVTNSPAAQQLNQDLQRNMQVRSSEGQRQQTLEEKVKHVMPPNYFILASRVQLTSELLGTGKFGQVNKAWLTPAIETREEEGQCQKQLVAVKILLNQEQEMVTPLLKEALNVHKLEHCNVVKMIGIVWRGEQSASFKLVMEYADGGSLQDYVHKNQGRLGTMQFKLILKKLAVDVARGLHYVCQIQSRVHGDLAARNVLLFSVDGRGSEPLTAKLGDFGQSHVLTRGYYDLRKSEDKKHYLPICQFPPELLQGYDQTMPTRMMFTVYTDVWAYGVFLWEIFSNKRPEKEMGTTQPMAVLKKISQAKPWPRPEYCPLKMYENVMLKCWALCKEDRPKFDKLVAMIEDLTEHDME